MERGAGRIIAAVSELKRVIPPNPKNLEANSQSVAETFGEALVTFGKCGKFFLDAQEQQRSNFT
jgi:hypothetical protein